MFCFYCQQPCGANGFCDETCKREYDADMRLFQDSIREDLPGESQHAADFGEPEEWDVVGGL